MSRKARSEPGWRMAGGCVRHKSDIGIFRKSIFRCQAQGNILCNLPSQFEKGTVNLYIPGKAALKKYDNPKNNYNNNSMHYNSTIAISAHDHAAYME